MPGFCRAAVEAACTRLVRRRRLGRGEPLAEIEAALLSAVKLRQKLALALFDDAGRTGDLTARLRAIGSSAPGTVDELNRGAHGGFQGDPIVLQSETRRLVEGLLRP